MQKSLPLPSRWLRSFYFARGAFSATWITVAVAFAHDPGIAAFLLVIYPAWDAVANLVDARSNGGLQANPSQSLNVAVSTTTAAAVVVALSSAHAVLAVFGVWAIISGLLQLYTGARRWRQYGAQWVMILSGAQSGLAGGFMISRSFAEVTPTILDIVPYAAFGAFYFLLSAVWLLMAAHRRPV